MERVRCRGAMAVFLLTASILLVLTMAPTDKAYALTINGGMSFTNNPDVTLQLNIPFGTYRVDVSNQGGPVTTISSPSSSIPWTLSAGDGFKTVDVTCSFSQPYTCSVPCGSYCCGGYDFWGNCNSYCTQYCTSTCYNSGSSTESATITLDVRSVNTGTNPNAAATNPVTNKIYVVNQGSAGVTVINGATGTTTTVAVGASPIAVAVNPATNRIYVANNGSSNVTVIDGATNATTTVPAGVNPNAIAVNPVTNRIYVTNQGSNTVTVIDGATNGVITTFNSLPGTPVAIAVNPVTNRIYVANNGSNNVTVIDGATNDTTFVAVGAAPQGVAVNPVTNRIYVANASSNDVTVIDGATNATSGIPVGVSPSVVAVNPVTNRIYVANQGSNTVTAIDGATNSPTTIAVGTTPYAVAVNPATNMIYVANYNSNNITVVDGVTNATAAVSAGVNPCAVGMNPVTNKAYVVNYGSANVIVIDGATNDTTTITAGTNPYAAAVNPATNRIYVANQGSNDVTVIDGATNATTGVTVGAYPVAAAVNPLTNRIYIANNHSDNVTVIDGATNATTTVAAGASPRGVAVNPVTNRIYINNVNSGSVTVIDGATNAATMVATGAFPQGIAVNPATNRIYTANGSNSVTVIDGSTNTSTTVSAGTNPYAVTVNPITDKIYVANAGSNNVTVIDGATNVTTIVSVGTAPQSIAVNPVTNKIYVANAGSNNVTVIDGATGATATIAAGGSPQSIAVNPVTNKIFVANAGSNEVTIIDGITGATTTAVTGGAPVAVAVNPVTGRIFVANSSGSSVTVIAEQQAQGIPLTVSVTPLAWNVSHVDTPTFDYSTVSGYAPTAPPVQMVYYQVDTQTGAWQQATPVAGSGSFPIPAQALGMHTLYVFAVDGQEATSVNTGNGSSSITGQVAAYYFAITTPALPSTTSVSATPNPSTYGDAVTITATVTSGATGTVSFAEGGTIYCGDVALSGTTATCSISTLSEGLHTITATYGGDAAFSGSSGFTAQTVNSPPDTTPPATPTGVVATAASSTRINVTWNAATDNVGVTEYRVYRGGIEVGIPAGTAFNDTGLSASTGYSYTVAACDAAENCSSQSSPPATATTLSAAVILPYAYWTFDDDTANDTVGTNHGAIVGSGVTFAAGKAGRAISFGSGTSFVRIPGFNLPYLTVEAWVNSAKSGYYTSMVTKSAHADTWASPWQTWQLWLSENTANPGFNGSTGGIASPDAVPMNQWFHLAATYDGDTIKTYVNGVEKASQTLSTPTPLPETLGNIYIGAPEFSNHSFLGLIDEVAIWDHALSAEVIGQHYQNGLGGQGYLYRTDTITTVASTPNPSLYGGPVTFTATVTSGATGKVSFTEGETTYCAEVALTGTTATCTVSSLGVGPHTITATYGGDESHNGSSGALSEPHTVVANFNVAVTIAGTGGGSVNSVPSGLSCTTGTCNASFNVGVDLIATPDWKSVFAGWSGACNGSGACSLTMDANKSVTADFGQNLQARMVGSSTTYHSTLQSALDGATSGSYVQAKVFTFFEDILFNRPVSANLEGGKDASWAATAGVTTVKGSLRIRNGVLRVRKVVIK
jgi:YVTN family beta-propeller protein